MPIIHVKISYKSEILKDWEVLPVGRETKIKVFFGDISILYLSSEWCNSNFEVKFSPSKTLVREKISAECIAREAAWLVRVPEFNDLPKNALEKLRIDLSNWIKNYGGRWKGKDAARHIGKQFVTDLASSLCWHKIQDSNDINDSMKKLFSIVKVNNILTCNNLIEISYYSSGLFKEALCFNCGVECEEHTNYGEYFPYYEDCNTLVKNKKRKRKEKKFVKSSKQRYDEIN
ncbi:hypothetical protein RclHR1_02580007 [Rhizophagus clarus]|uniref:Uncharacterized protein n=1 Tax=Rhizophagus clarus TaxID=94130 RepID=A0A2Z6RCD5_9GLOM|nr:hypothetical protein RclHR1_02580007 [Rhizophagus clarus]